MKRLSSAQGVRASIHRLKFSLGLPLHLEPLCALLITHGIPCQVVSYYYAFAHAALSAWETLPHFTSLANVNQTLMMPSWVKSNLTAQTETSSPISAQPLYPPRLLSLFLQYFVALTYLFPSTRLYVPQNRERFLLFLQPQYIPSTEQPPVNIS